MKWAISEYFLHVQINVSTHIGADNVYWEEGRGGVKGEGVQLPGDEGLGRDIMLQLKKMI